MMLQAVETVLNGGTHLSRALQGQLFQSEKDGVKAPADQLRRLYNRELQVLQLIGRGRTTKEIASELELSPKTVESYRESLKKKLGIPDGLTLVRLATIWEHEGRLAL